MPSRKDRWPSQRGRGGPLNWNEKEREFLQTSRWRTLQAKRRIRRLLAPSSSSACPSDDEDHPPQLPNICRKQLPKDTRENSAGILGLYKSPKGVKSKCHYAKVAEKAMSNFGELTDSEKHEFFYAFTRGGFKDSLGVGELPDGSKIEETKRGKYKDKYGIIRDEHGPFWPPDYGPLHPAQEHRGRKEPAAEPLQPRGFAQGEKCTCLGLLTIAAMKPSNIRNQ